MQTEKAESNNTNPGKDTNPGEVFLEKQDDIHKKLLRKLNWLLYYDPNDTWKQGHQDEIANFAQEHYKTFIAAMQNGLPAHRFNQLKETNINALLNIIKQADEKGMILAKYNGQAYLINTKDKNKKTLNLINPKKIVVTAHPYRNYDEFRYAASQENDDILHLYPLNDKCLSFISSRQTEGVENTCKIINHFTENHLNKYKKKMNVTLKGESQGVDFITKMVGSTHGKKNRIKNANINLDINAPHIFQDGEKIVKRLTNGVENNNTITNIHINNDLEKCLHPIEKTISLINHLRAKRNELNKSEIELKIDNELKKTLEEYQWSHVHNDITPDLKWLNALKEDNIVNV